MKASDSVVDQNLLKRARALAAAATAMAENLKSIGPITMPDLSCLDEPEGNKIADENYERYKQENWIETKSSSPTAKGAPSTRHPKRVNDKVSQMRNIIPPIKDVPVLAFPDNIQVANEGISLEISYHVSKKLLF